MSMSLACIFWLLFDDTNTNNINIFIKKNSDILLYNILILIITQLMDNDLKIFGLQTNFKPHAISMIVIANLGIFHH